VLRRTVRPALAVLVATAVAAVTVGTAQGDLAPPGTNAGPPYEFTHERIGDGTAVPLKDQAMLTTTKHGYRLRIGQQNSHLTVTLVNAGLRFADTGTTSFKGLSPDCRHANVTVGVAAVCRVPAGTSLRSPLLIEVWPRLGDDYTDTSTLPATFAVSVLGDEGNDVTHFGAGPDFFNGYSGHDRVWGGAGNDWIRSGLGTDAVIGGPGNDDIVAVEGRDRVGGGDGADRLWGGDGGDRLWGGAGVDLRMCGNGHDRTEGEGGDHASSSCEAADTP
jgi:serralysin